MIYLLIFGLSIYLCSQKSLMYENLTGVAQLAQFRPIVIGFTILSACFFAYKMYNLFSHLPKKYYLYKIMIIITAVIMSCGALFPYTLNQHDFYSSIHVACSLFGCVSFLILLLIYTRMLSLYDYDTYLQVHWFYDWSLRFLCLFIIVFARVNGYIEIFFTFIVCTYLFMVEKKLYKKF